MKQHQKHTLGGWLMAIVVLGGIFTTMVTGNATGVIIAIIAPYIIVSVFDMGGR